MKFDFLKKKFIVFVVISHFFIVDCNAAPIAIISPQLKNLMEHTTWHRGCPVAINDLRLVTVPYWGFDQQLHENGQLIVHKKVASEVLAIFVHLAQQHFPIRQIKLIEYYQGNEMYSMRMDNTSAFNCRTVTNNSRRFSLHSYGLAIDINPLENPYLFHGQILDAKAQPFLNRKFVRMGMIESASSICHLFSHYQWLWGGNWHDPKDYQHFQKVFKI